MKRLKVKEIMCTDLVTLDENEDLDLAENVMTFARIRHLPVVRGERLVGLVTHRDLLRAQISSLAGINPSDSTKFKSSIKARDIMSLDVTTIDPETTVLEAAKILKKHKFGCLPVVEEKKLVGIITEADFIDLVIRALDG